MMAPESDLPTLAAPTEEDRRLRLRRFLSRIDSMDQICDHVSNGGSIPGLARVLNVPPGHVTRWIRADKDRMSKYENALADRNEWEKENILAQLRAIGSFDVRELFKNDGELKDVHDWPDAAAVAVAGLDINGDNKRIKLIDRLKALELSGKSLSMFKEKVEHSGMVTLEQLILGDDEVQVEYSSTDTEGAH